MTLCVRCVTGLACMFQHLPRNPQAKTSLQAYGMHAVVANLLHTRKDRVLLVVRGTEGVAVEDVVRPAEEPLIERLIVQRIVAVHQAAWRA